MNQKPQSDILLPGAESQAQRYDEYLGPLFFEPYAIDVASLVDPSVVSNALEIGCGTGRVTRHLRNILSPASSLVASDISQDMLAVAKEKLQNRNIEWKIIDAESLPFETDSIDLVVCYFGYMFVPDKAKAFGEALRVLRKGGMLLMATWDTIEHNEASHVFRKTVERYFGEPLPESSKVASSMHDPAANTQMLQVAGFSKIDSYRIEKQMHAETARSAAQALVKGGSLYNEIEKRNPAWVDEIIAAVEKELSEKYGKAPMIAPISAIMTQGWK
jgi:ubiquinone/menaquinone biosynthesis C-methylase UbiE